MLECFKVGLYWRGIVHDLSKFKPSEFFPYANHFYSTERTRQKNGYYKPTNTNNEAFCFAWHLHQKRNRHHWSWWVLPEDGGGNRVFPIQEKYLKEMICDWLGARKAQKQKNSVPYWWKNYGHKFIFEHHTRTKIEKFIEKI